MGGRVTTRVAIYARVARVVRLSGPEKCHKEQFGSIQRCTPPGGDRDLRGPAIDHQQQQACGNGRPWALTASPETRKSASRWQQAGMRGYERCQDDCAICGKRAKGSGGLDRNRRHPFGALRQFAVKSYKCAAMAGPCEMERIGKVHAIAHPIESLRSFGGFFDCHACQAASNSNEPPGAMTISSNCWHYFEMRLPCPR